MPPILSSITHPNGRHRRINNRTSCVKHSQLSCQREQSIKLAWMLCRVQPRVNKVNFLLRQIHTSNPLGANFRASESKASSSLECSAERSRKSTKLKLVCEYRPGRPGFKSLSPEGKGDLGESGGAPTLRVKKGTGEFSKKEDDELWFSKEEFSGTVDRSLYRRNIQKYNLKWL